jgi:hypothetical protein
LAKCQFNTEYVDFERGMDSSYNCDSKDEDILPSGLCIFHDENYLKEDEDNRKEHEQKVRDRLMSKIYDSIAQNEALFCIGYHLPDITIREVNFTKPAYFSKCEFQGTADFSEASFQGTADFSEASFTASFLLYSDTNFIATLTTVAFVNRSNFIE